MGEWCTGAPEPDDDDIGVDHGSNGNRCDGKFRSAPVSENTLVAKKGVWTMYSLLDRAASVASAVRLLGPVVIVISDAADGLNIRASLRRFVSPTARVRPKS